MEETEISKKGIVLSLIAIALIIGLINSVSAMYAGESETILLTEEFEYYSIVGNNSPINLNVTQNNFEVTITPNKYTKNETFTIIFFNKEKEIIETIKEIHTGGGGSSGTDYVDRIIYEPKFFDRNITEIIEVEVEKNNTIEIITYQETGWELHHIIFTLIVGLIIGFIVCYFLWYYFSDGDEN